MEGQKQQFRVSRVAEWPANLERRAQGPCRPALMFGWGWMLHHMGLLGHPRHRRSHRYVCVPERGAARWLQQPAGRDRPIRCFPHSLFSTSLCDSSLVTCICPCGNRPSDDRGPRRELKEEHERYEGGAQTLGRETLGEDPSAPGEQASKINLYVVSHRKVDACRSLRKGHRCFSRGRTKSGPHRPTQGPSGRSLVAALGRGKPMPTTGHGFRGIIFVFSTGGRTGGGAQARSAGGHPNMWPDSISQRSDLD